MQQAQNPSDIRIMDVLEFLIRSGPGRTERQLAEAIFGESGYQQRVNQDCALMVIRGRVERKGAEGGNDPFTYWPAV